MNYKEFAEMWYAGASDTEDNAMRRRGFATAIDKHFVSRDEIRELEVRFARAIRTISELQHDAFRAGFAEDAERLRGKGEGLKLALAYLTEMEATE